VVAKERKKLRLALVGSETLRGKEIRHVLSVKKFPLQSFEFYDPDVAEEFSRLSQFKDEPKVVHHLDHEALAGLDLVFLAADSETNAEYGGLAAKLGYKAIDLGETFSGRSDIPVVVAGVNDAVISGKKVPLVANPNPVTIILAHLFYVLGSAFGIHKALAVVLEPVSAFEEKGIKELAEQSTALLAGSCLTKKVFHDQIAFNLLARTTKPDANGFSAKERQILSEIHRVMGPADFPLSLSVVLAPVFHTYSIMTHVELKRDPTMAELKAGLQNYSTIKLEVDGGTGSISAATVAGKDKVFIGQIKKEESRPGSFWIWAVADNLTLGSALNAYDVARSLFALT
jgi:aspartate-semialdehyde dehydrogenase